MFHDVYQAVCSESRSRADHSHMHPPEARVGGCGGGGGGTEGVRGKEKEVDELL